MKSKRLLKLSSAACLILVLAVLPLVAACAAPTPTPQPPPPTVTVTPTPTPTPKTPDELTEELYAKALEEGKLNLYGYTFSGDFAEKVKDYWWQRFAIKVTTFPSGSGAVVEKWRAEAASGQTVGDAAGGALFILNALLEGDLLKKFVTPDLLPELQKYPLTDTSVWVADPTALDGYGMSNGVAPNPIFINTNLVPPGQEPKSYKDLLDPKWKGKIAMPSPELDGEIYLLYNTIGPEGTNVLDMDYFKALGEQVVVVPSHKEAMGRVATGEFAISFNFVITVANQLIVDGGAPCKSVQMEEGTIVDTAGEYVIAAKGPNPYAALFFANWMLTREGVIFYARERPQVPRRHDVELLDPLPAAILTPLVKAIPFPPSLYPKMIQQKKDRVIEILWGM